MPERAYGTAGAQTQKMKKAAEGSLCVIWFAPSHALRRRPRNSQGESLLKPK